MKIRAKKKSRIRRNAEDVPLTGSYWRPLEVIIVSAKSRMSAPTSADTESQQPARRIIRRLNKMLHKGGKRKSVILTLTLHGHCDVNIYFQFTVDDKEKKKKTQSVPTRTCKCTRV